MQLICQFLSHMRCWSLDAKRLEQQSYISYISSFKLDNKILASQLRCFIKLLIQ